MITFSRTDRPKRRVVKKARRIKPQGLKRQYAPVPGAQETYRTPWFAKKVKRDRAATRSARLARKRNRLIAQRAKRASQRKRRIQQGGKS